MATRDEIVEIVVADDRIAGTVVAPAAAAPGMVFVHGWGGSQEQYLARAREIAALGCICLTFDLRGHVRHAGIRDRVTREDNLQDLLAAYDRLLGQVGVNPSAIGVIGSSYGGYLAAILTSLRPVRWLALRAPAIYKDEGWNQPKRALNEDPDLHPYRRRAVPPEENRALRACAEFEGDVLIVESERDDVVPHETIANYTAACVRARSLTTRVIEHADHGLEEEPWQRAYTSVLVNWLTEMVLETRHGGKPVDQRPRTLELAEQALRQQ